MRKSTEEKIKKLKGFNYENWMEKGEHLGYMGDISLEVQEADYHRRKFYSLKQIISDMSYRIRKLEDIIKVNNYEYKTETKLVKVKEIK